MQRVDLNLLETAEFDIFLDAKYNGIPFTGIGYEQTENFYSEYRYENGFGHGRCYSVYPDGQLMEETFLEHGKRIIESSWYKNGRRRTHVQDNIDKVWFENGNLYRVFDEIARVLKVYYETGELKLSRKYYEDGSFCGSTSVYYDKARKPMFELKNLNDEPGDGFVKMRTGDWMRVDALVVAESFDTLLDDYELLRYWDNWITHLLKVDRERGVSLLFRMLKSENERTKDCAITLSARENVLEALPLLKEAKSDTRKPPEYREPGLSVGCHIWGRTIAEQASYAIAELEGNTKFMQAEL